jgi:hypothetical protein
MVAEKISTTKMRSHTLYFDNKKDPLMASQQLARPHPSQALGIKIQIYLKYFALRRECQSTLFTQGHIGNCYMAFSHPGTQRIL